MTDDELKALVASVAVAQKETAVQMKQTDEKMKENAEQMKENSEQIKRINADLVASQKETSEQIKRTNADLVAIQKETSEQMKRTDAKLERMGIYLGNISNNQGDVAEEFFYNSLIKDNHLGGIYFDDITKNMEKHRGDIQEEYDLFMTNSDAIAIVEVKYKAHYNDLDKLDRKMRHFKLLFPIYQQYKLYGALASFYINDDTKKEALNRGYFVLQRCGDIIHAECNPQLKIL